MVLYPTLMCRFAEAQLRPMWSCLKYELLINYFDLQVLDLFGIFCSNILMKMGFFFIIQGNFYLMLIRALQNKFENYLRNFVGNSFPGRFTIAGNVPWEQNISWETKFLGRLPIGPNECPFPTIYLFLFLK